MVARPGRPAFYAPAGGGRIADAVTLLHPPVHALASELLRARRSRRTAPLRQSPAVGARGVRPRRRRRRARARRAARPAAAHRVQRHGAAGHGRRSACSARSRSASPGSSRSRRGWLRWSLAGGLFVPAYNLEWQGGRFHSDLWFALGWGAFPAFTGYFVNASQVSLAGVLIAAGCMAMSVAQRRLSSAARELRRRTVEVHGVRERTDGSSEELTRRAAAAAARRCTGGALADRAAARGGAARRAALAAPSGQRGRMCAPGPGATSMQSAGTGRPGSNRPSTDPPKPPPIRRAPAAPARSSFSTVASTAGVETW